MTLMRSRLLWVAVALLLFLNSGEAMGCHTDCSLTVPRLPNPCLTCGFRALSNVACSRSSCDACDTVDCGEIAPSRTSNLMSEACSVPVTPVSTLRIVKVQRLGARG